MTIREGFEVETFPFDHCKYKKLLHQSTRLKALPFIIRLITRWLTYLGFNTNKPKIPTSPTSSTSLWTGLLLLLTGKHIMSQISSYKNIHHPEEGNDLTIISYLLTFKMKYSKAWSKFGYPQLPPL